MMSTPSANNRPLISRDRAGAAIGAAIRLYVGRARRYSVKQLSNGTGIKDRVIECAMADPDSTDYRPLPMEALLSVTLFLGAEFACEWLRLAQLGAFELPGGDDLPPGILAAEAADDTATLARAAADGVIDRDEAPQVRRAGMRMMSRGATLARIGCAA